VSKADKRARQKANTRAAREAREAKQKRRNRFRLVRNALIAAVVVAGIYLLLNATTGKKKSTKVTTATSTTSTPPTTTKPLAKPPTTIDPAEQYTATITTNFGTIVVALDAKAAPVAANNFVYLADKGFYDGLRWTRAAKDFVIQGGDPTNTGSGGPGYTVQGEVPTDHYPIGSVAAAKTSSAPAGTFGSQFFIVTGSQGETLPNDYARFGTVTKGLDVAQKIDALAPASGDGPPTKTATIDTITIAVTNSSSSSTTSPTSAAPTSGG